MKQLYLDLIGGAAGDMLLAALLDAGADRAFVETSIQALGLEEMTLLVQSVLRQGIAAKQLMVSVHEEAKPRRYAEIRVLLAQAPLDERVRSLALRCFAALAEAEARVHGVSPETIHFHEVGANDALADIVGTCAAFVSLQVGLCAASEVPLGRGFVRAAHGRMPVPAPATLELLQGIPLFAGEIEAERTTPTGAALLRTLCTHFGPLSSMRLIQIGYGAGHRELPIPNIVRAMVGETDSTPNVRQVVELRAEVDDMTGEEAGAFLSLALEAGALDAYLTPLTMKKGRPGLLLTVLCSPTQVNALQQLMLKQTSTLGVRQEMLWRQELPRSMQHVETPWGVVPVKIAQLEDGSIKVAAEYEAAFALAQQQQLPLRTVLHGAEDAAWKTLSKPTNAT